MSRDDLNLIKKKVGPFLKNVGVKKVGIFGSYARENKRQMLKIKGGLENNE